MSPTLATITPSGPTTAVTPLCPTTATVLAFPPPGPSRLSQAALGALEAFGRVRPGVEITFGACDDGDQWAIVGRGGSLVAAVNARRLGRTEVLGAAYEPLGTFGANDAVGIADALRQAIYGDLPATP